MRPPDWTDQAKCGPTNGTKDYMFFAVSDAAEGDDKEEAQHTETTKGRRFCTGRDGTPRCPVIDECLEYAIENDERFGVWGGLSTRSRLRLIAARDRQRSTFG